MGETRVVFIGKLKGRHVLETVELAVKQNLKQVKKAHKMARGKNEF